MVERHKPIYSQNFLTPEFRVSYPSVFEAKADLQGDMFYSITMLFDKDADLSGIKKVCQELASQLGWEKDKYKTPLEDGNIKFNDNKQQYSSYENMIVAKAKSKNRPGIVDRMKKDILNPSDFFGGCYARAQLTAKTYVMAGRNGITFQLVNLQKTRDGEAFGRVAPDAKDVFSEVNFDDDASTNSILD